MRFCTYCGNKLPDDAAFCPDCGAPVEKDAVKSPAATEIPQSEPIYEEPKYEAHAPEQPQTKSVIKEKRKNSPLSIIAFVLSFFGWLGLPAAALGVLDLVKGNKEKKHGFSIAAVIIGVIMTVAMISNGLSSCSCNSKPTSYSNSSIVSKEDRDDAWEKAQREVQETIDTANQEDDEALTTEEAELDVSAVVQATAAIPTAEATQVPTSEPTPTPTSEPTPTPTSEPTEQPKTLTQNTIRPEVKAAIDSYEEFYDQYCEFMRKYDASNISMLVEYGKLISQEYEMDKKWDAIKEMDLTEAENKYLFEVETSVTKKLLDLSVELNNK